MWKLYAVLSAVFAALTAILAKIGIKNVSPTLATGIRTIVILLLAWGIVIGSGQLKEIKHLSRSNVTFLVLSGLATGLSWLFYFKALATGPASKVAPIDKLSVALTIGLAFIILKEPLSPQVIIGGLLIVAGSVLLLQ